MDSIKGYWIQQIQETKEFQQIANAEDPEVLELKQKIHDLIDEEFIETSTEIGISRREKLLYITPKKSDSLQDRRLAVFAKWGKKTPITYRKLESVLDSMIGNKAYKMELFNDEYYLQVDFELSNYKTVRELKKMLRRLIPANLGIVAIMTTTLDDAGIFISSTISEYALSVLNDSIERAITGNIIVCDSFSSYEVEELPNTVTQTIKSHLRTGSAVVQRETEVIR